ncbi:6-phosphofructokinase [Ruminococcaceae bacterium YRB3002]|nr:6-phosphofructokinase [Ruminococcaceae bacterium YRB3002]
MPLLYTENDIPDINSLRAKCYDNVNPDEVEPIKRIGVLTSGGDAPGMNAAIRSVVRAGWNAGFEVYGVTRGFHGLWKGEMKELSKRDVSETLQRGGTFLMTARSKTFQTTAGVIKGARMMETYGLDALIVIGGDGSYKGARALARVGMNVIGIPGTIDNDIASTEYTIGYDTSMNTAMEAIDKLRDTASSHERCSVIEVMGRSAGYIALNVGIATGAEVILIPEVPYDFNKDVLRIILDGRNHGKKHYIVIVAEGAGSATEIARQIEEATEIESRPTILGHLQRGGSPTLRDRTTASLMGIQAIDCLLAKRYNRIIIEKDGKISDVDIEQGLEMSKTIPERDIINAKRLG